MLRGAVTLESCDGACIRTGSEIDEGGEGGVMDMDEQELELEDKIFEELSAEEEEETFLDAVLLGEDEEGFVQGSVDVEDLATGFSATMPTRETDVDEDTQGDEVPQAAGDTLLTEFEFSGGANGTVHGDEIELDLADTLTTGRTITGAPKDNSAL